MARTGSRKALTIRPRRKAGRRSSPKRRKGRKPARMAGQFLPEGVSLMARKRSKRRSRRGTFAGARRVRRRRSRRASFHGFDGARRTRRRSRRSYLGGGMSMKGLMPLIMSAAATIGGAVGGSMLSARIPAPDKVKPLIPLAAGIALNVTKLGRNQLVRAAGLGMMVAGGLSLIRQFAPQLPMLGAADEAEELLGLPAVAGEDEELLGLIEDDLSGLPAVAGYDEDSYMGAHATGADI